MVLFLKNINLFNHSAWT